MVSRAFGTALRRQQIGGRRVPFWGTCPAPSPWAPGEPQRRSLPQTIITVKYTVKLLYHMCMGQHIFTNLTHLCNGHLDQETIHVSTCGQDPIQSLLSPKEALSQTVCWFHLFLYLLWDPISCPQYWVLSRCDSATLLHVVKTCSFSVLHGIPACDYD